MVAPESAAILITGASSGIGEACVKELDRRGFRVFAGVRNEADGRRLKEHASARLEPILIDVTQPEMIAAAAETIRGAVGPGGLWGLVNNAGICVSGPVELVPLDELRRQFEVNVFGQVAVIQRMLPLVRAARGRIVNMGSISGLLAAPFLSPYSASKHAMEAVTDSLRREVRRWGISVSILEPTSYRTPIWDKTLAWGDRMMEKIPPEADALYGEDLRAMRSTAERIAAGAPPVDRVVQAVVHALTARRPRTRYPLGSDTWFVAHVFPFLPDRLCDWLVCRMAGLRPRSV